MTIRAVDEFWNRVPGVNNQLTLSSSDAFASFPTSVSLLNGEVTVPVTLYAAGRQTIHAADADSTDITEHTSNEVVVLPGTYSRILILAPGETIAHGTEKGALARPPISPSTIAFTVTVYATDQWWNPVGVARTSCA